MWPTEDRPGRDVVTPGATRARWRRALDGDRGAATVEAALSLCSLVVVLALAVAAVGAAMAQLRCLDAAREAARLVARGESERAREAAMMVAPHGATIEVELVADLARVRVSAPAVPGLGVLALTAVAAAVLEPDLEPLAGPSSGQPPAGPSSGDAAVVSPPDR